MHLSVPAADIQHILDRTENVWREIAGTRLFITGGTGFFGTWLLETIAAANDVLNVCVGATVLSRNPDAFHARMPHLAARDEFEWLRGQPGTFDFPRQKHHFIVHLATATSPHAGRTEPRQMLETKLAGIGRVLDFARHTAVRRVLVASSGAVYGRQPPDMERMPESYTGAPDPLEPDSAYGHGKRLIEQMCTITPNVDCVIARCFSFIGPHLPLDARFAAGNFLRDALTGGPIVIHGDGCAVRSYLHAADLTVWLLTMLVRGSPGRAYNVGSDAPVSVLQLANAIAATAPRRCDVRVLGAPELATPNRYVPEVRRAREELGLNVDIPL